MNHLDDYIHRTGNSQLVLLRFERTGRLHLRRALFLVIELANIYCYTPA